MTNNEAPYIGVLNSVPLTELRYRAAVVTDLSLTDASFASPSITYRVGNAVRHATNDSGGQSVKWYFTDDGRALLLTFEHEGDLNVAGPDDDFALMTRFYRGVPDDLMRLAADRTKAYENLVATDPATGDVLMFATGVVWFDGTGWHYADGLLDYCATENVDLLEAGLYLLEPYLLGEDFTPETYVDHFMYEGWDGPDRDALLAQVRPVFARHRPAG